MSRPPTLLARLAASRAAAAPALRARFNRLRLSAQAALFALAPSEPQYVFAITVVIGAVCGLVAVGFHLSIRAAEALLIDRALAASGWSWIAWTLITPTAGGLLVGAGLTYLVPAARGSGIPQVKQAFAQRDARIRFRDAVGKFVLSVLQIGSGASLGREGPTVYLTAGVASLLARATPLGASDRRRLMPVGVAAGIAAAFNAPIAAVTFTIEEIVGALDQTVLAGVVVAAAVAAVIERSVLGVHPVIGVSESYGLEHASSLPLYALLGVCAAFVSILFSDALLELRAAFRRTRLGPRWAHPAVGGLVTGAVAVAVLLLFKSRGITGGGYETLGLALHGRLAVHLLVVLCLAKVLATVFSYSSGGAGGVFAPSLFIGAMLGGVLGWVELALLDHGSHELGAFALVGMGAVFAGVVRAPITSVLIIFEMTGGYGLVLPLMIANMISYGLARRFRPTPLYDALLEQDGVHLPARSSSQSLEHLDVRSAMSEGTLTLTADLTVAAAVEAVKGRTFSVAPVVDAAGRLVGAVSLANLRKAAPEDTVGGLVAEAPAVSATARLSDAAAQMGARRVRQLVVLDASERVVGVLAMSDVLRAHARAAAAARAPEEERAEPAGEALLATRVGLLAIDAAPVPVSTALSDVLDRLVGARGATLPLEPSGGAYAVLELEHVRELWPQGEQLDGVVIAADVARKAPAIGSDADLLRALELMDREKLDALPVVDGPAGSPPRGVLLRADVGRFLFAHYSRRARGGAGVSVTP